MDTSRPLEFPTTPELILEYHRQKPCLNNNEEWLIVELNEYECLVDSFEILRIIAKHSKFFEVRVLLVLVGKFTVIVTAVIIRNNYFQRSLAKKI